MYWFPRWYAPLTFAPPPRQLMEPRRRTTLPVYPPSVLLRFDRDAKAVFHPQRKLIPAQTEWNALSLFCLTFTLRLWNLCRGSNFSTPPLLHSDRKHKCQDGATNLGKLGVNVHRRMEHLFMNIYFKQEKSFYPVTHKLRSTLRCFLFGISIMKEVMTSFAVM